MMNIQSRIKKLEYMTHSELPKGIESYNLFFLPDDHEKYDTFKKLIEKYPEIEDEVTTLVIKLNDTLKEK